MSDNLIRTFNYPLRPTKAQEAILEQWLVALQQFYKSFFRRLKHGENPGFPRFKPRDRYSFVNLQGNKIKVHLYRPIPEGTIIKSGQVRCTPRGWILSIVPGLGHVPTKKDNSSEIGAQQ